MEQIHSTAIVSKKAQLGNNVKILPYAIIEDDVIIGDDSVIGPHACLYDGARIGNRVKILQGASVSNTPQDLKYDNEPTKCFIGDDTVIREFATLHRGTTATEKAEVGKNCLIMAYVHVAHDVVVGNNVIIANSVQMAGHVEIEDNVTIGGLTAVHQFTRVGQHAMVGAGFKIVADVPPYALAGREPLKFLGLNAIGLKRKGFTSEDLVDIKKAYHLLYNSGLIFSEAKLKLKEEYTDHKYVSNIIEFLDKTRRTILRP